MPLENIARCDQCGISKQESNHWLMATIRTREGTTTVRFQEFDARRAKGKKTFCGNPCFLQKLSAEMPLANEVKP